MSHEFFSAIAADLAEKSRKKTSSAVAILRRRYGRKIMRLAVRQLKDDDDKLSAKAGDIILVNLEYDWDPEKVEVLCVLPKGSYPSLSAYKECLTKPTPEELVSYLEGKKDEQQGDSSA